MKPLTFLPVTPIPKQNILAQAIFSNLPTGNFVQIFLWHQINEVQFLSGKREVHNMFVSLNIWRKNLEF